MIKFSLLVNNISGDYFITFISTFKFLKNFEIKIVAPTKGKDYPFLLNSPINSSHLPPKEIHVINIIFKN